MRSLTIIIMSTESLRKDHELIDKVVKSMEVTVSLLKNGTKIPESILMPVIDFTKNFTDVCHHGKEEESFFPALEKTGMPKNMGPIAVMLMEHEITRQIALKMEDYSKEYLISGNSEKLIEAISQYVQHMNEHLWKENNRLFMMGDMRLQGQSGEVNASLSKVEQEKLGKLGKTRQDYETMAQNIESSVTNLKN